MATSFTDLLRLTLQGTGDNPSTWGQIANLGVFELLEDAISGYETVDVTGSSDVTLTTGNGVPDQARKAILELTGFPTANNSVIVPTVTKIYLVRATFTGDHKITVKTTTGQGVEFTQGQRKFVFCDGLDVIQVSEDLGDLAYLDTITSAGLIDPGVITTSLLSDKSVTLPKIEDISGRTILGNPVVTSGEVTEITASTNPTVLVNTSAGLSFDKINADMLDVTVTEHLINTDNRHAKTNSTRFVIPAKATYGKVDEMSLDNIPLKKGNIFIVFNMMNKKRWGSRDFRLLVNGIVLAERRYQYVGSAYEADISFDIMIPYNVPADGNYNIEIQHQGVDCEVDIGCGIYTLPI